MTEREAFELYFSGAEVPDHRKRLTEGGAKHLGIAFINLRPRLPKTRTYRVAEKFPTTAKILLTPGSKKDIDAETISEEYQDFVALNIDRLDLVCEFDHSSLDDDFIEHERTEFWHTLPVSKYVPVWRPRHGLDELEALVNKFEHVAIPPDAFELDVNLQPVLNRFVARTGVNLHALGITQPDELLRIHFASASSTSWTSPSRFGDRIVWDGTRLRRYPASYKDTANRRHRTLFERAGFDAEAIANDDPKEVLAFSIWSWLQFEAWLQRHRNNPTWSAEDDTDEDDEAGTTPDEGAAEDADLTPAVRGTRALERRHVVPRDAGDRVNIPVLGFEVTEIRNDAGEKVGERSVPTVGRAVLRSCDSCHVAATCPAYKAEADCAYEIPVVIRDRDQLVATMNTLIEIQMQRIAFLRFSEELEGGYPDKNLTAEMQSLFDMVKKMRDVTENRASLSIHAEARGSAGILSRLFGDHVGDAQKELERPVDSNELMDVVDAEII